MVVDKAERGLLFVMVGPGGAGKNTLMKVALAEMDDLFELVTTTTRDKRPGEIDGIDYHFLTKDQFLSMITNNQLVEYQEVTPGNFYGVPRASVEQALEAGRDIIADIEVLGARILKQSYPTDTVLVFVTVPGNSEADILSNLRERMEIREDTEDVILERLERAKLLELPFQAECDHTIINEDRDTAATQLMEIIQQERVARQDTTQVCS
ncbi:MAG: guanylate kinase [Anaerolineae bacterium]|nr:guanylate kinase [Anaerolineae bacterium]MCA9891831.1 guanylate kinase [Anaerolineae bacterium]